MKFCSRFEHELFVHSFIHSFIQLESYQRLSYLIVHAVMFVCAGEVTEVQGARAGVIYLSSAASC